MSSGLIQRFLRRGGVATGGLMLIGEPPIKALKGGAAVAAASELLDLVSGAGAPQNPSSPIGAWLSKLAAAVPGLVAKRMPPLPLGDQAGQWGLSALHASVGGPADPAQWVAWARTQGVDDTQIQTLIGCAAGLVQAEATARLKGLRT